MPDSIQLSDAVRALFLVQMNDHLRIGMGTEAMAPRFKPLPDFTKVVDFPIEGQPDRAIFVAHRLAARLTDVNDRQAIVAERYILSNSGRAEASYMGSVWPTMTKGMRHSFGHRLEVVRSQAFTGDA